MKMSTVPPMLEGNTVLVPIKCDVTLCGARFVDTLTWNVYDPLITPDEFAQTTCSDLYLPLAFAPRIALQISEQVKAFESLIDAVRLASAINEKWSNKLKKPLLISLGVRHNSVDFSDKFYWNLLSDDITPEQFANITCQDLGLPGEMAPVIAHKIREQIFREFCSWIDDPKLLEKTEEAEEDQQQQQQQQTANSSSSSSSSSSISTAKRALNETKISLVSSGSTVEMFSTLWKRAKPNSVDDQATIPQPIMPENKDSNAHIWL